MIAVAAVGATAKIISANKNAKAAKDAATKAELKQQEQQELLDIEKAKFKSMKFENPYSNMENVYEDLTVNQQQAQFQAQQGSQQRANIMQNLRGAAGGSGVAGLAQAMANQGQLQTQQISASIGQQEAGNQALRAQGAANIQMKEREGQKMQQQFGIDKQATLLGMQQAYSAGADSTATAANQMALQGQMAKTEAIAGGIADVASAGVQGYSARQADPEQIDPLTSGIDPSNTTGMVQVRDGRSNSPTYGKIISAPAADRHKIMFG